MTEAREPTAWEVFNSGRAFSAWALDREYQPPEDRADTSIPGEFPVETGADNVAAVYDETTGYAFDVATDEALPWWTWYAVGGVGLLALLIALRPYASIGAGMVGG